MSYWSEFARKPVSRRTTLRAAGVAGIGIGGAALIGCGEDDTPARTPTPTVERDDGATPVPEEAAANLTVSPDEFQRMSLDDMLERLNPAQLPGLEGHVRAMREGPTTGGTLRYSRNAPLSWDPFGASPMTTSPGTHNSLITFRMDADFGPHGEIEAVVDLPESMEYADDVTMVFHMRDEPIYWHDVEPVNGREFTIEDVAFGVEALREGITTAHTYRHLESVETPDDKTLALHFSQPAAYFLISSAQPQHWLVSPEQVEAGTLGEWPIGTGPFLLERQQMDIGLSYVRNPHYFKTDPLYGTGERLPFLERIEGTFLPDAATANAAWAARQIDYNSLAVMSRLNVVEALRDRPDAVIVIVPPPPSAQPFHIMNMTNPPFNDERVRRALSMAIDRMAVIEGIIGGVASPGYAQDWNFYDRPQNPWPWTLEELGPWYQFNPQEANQLLQAAGFERGLGRPIEMGFSTSDAGLIAGIHLAMVDMYEQHLNVDMNIRMAPDGATYVRRLYTPDFPDMHIAWPRPAWDLDDFTYGMLHSQSPSNFHYVNDPVLDELCEKQQVTLDINERREYGRQIMERDLDEVYRIYVANLYKFSIRDPALYNLSDHYLAWMTPGWGERKLELTWVDR